MIAARALRHVLTVYCLACAALAPQAFAQDGKPAIPPPALGPAPDIAMRSPHITFAEIDWPAARAALLGLAQTTASGDDAAASSDMLLRLNAAAERIFTKGAVSPVPVLMPFDTAALLRDDAQGIVGDAGKYLLPRTSLTFFFAGPSGYDAVLSVAAQGIGLDLTFDGRIDVQFTGSALLYALDAPALAETSPVPELGRDFPGIRRVLLEERVRYVFTRFGATYALSMLCNDGVTRSRRLSCHEADKVATRVLRALNIVGGANG